MWERGGGPQDLSLTEKTTDIQCYSDRQSGNSLHRNSSIWTSVLLLVTKMKK